MADYFLHSCNRIIRNTNKYSVLQSYRYSKRRGLNIDLYESIWRVNKLEVLTELINKIQEIINTAEPFAFAMAPSNERFFIDAIEEKIQTAFPDATNFSACFTKNNNFEAATTTVTLSDEELKQKINIDENCFNERVPDNIKQILLVDDIYSLGNTFKAMSNLILALKNDKVIDTIVILKTT
ncbi:MAG: hypothetical protein JSS63_09510 [Bacteroidetes bacterium]|nr:hypothetical protein [Bacteroidota bacterium]